MSKRREAQERIRGATRPLSSSAPWWNTPDPDSADCISAIALAFSLLDNHRLLLEQEDSFQMYQRVQTRWPGFDKWIGRASPRMISQALYLARLATGVWR